MQSVGTPAGLGFTGEQSDASGLVYLRARFYNPRLGVFINRDPVLGFPGGESVRYNGYSYVHGNPVNYTDPSGEALPLLAIGLAALVWGGGYLLDNYVVPHLRNISINPCQPFNPLDPSHWLRYGLKGFGNFAGGITDFLSPLMGWGVTRVHIDALRNESLSPFERLAHGGLATINAALGINLSQTAGNFLVNLGRLGEAGLRGGLAGVHQLTSKQGLQHLVSKIWNEVIEVD